MGSVWVITAQWSLIFSFADDIILFLKADVANCTNLVSLIHEYCKASGQKVNIQKSNVFFGGNVPRGFCG